ncbi:MAG: hypothetical protein J6Y03_04620 [Alphaproteobacteria bacterium]|nr:hypothetical protein [Alphaproteobacteria bacterium]
MHRLRRFIEHVLSFSSAHLWVVGLLGVAAIIQGFNISLFDSFSSGLYLGTYGDRDLAFDFFIGAMVLSVCGWIALKIERHFGNGFILFLILSALFQGGIFWAWYYAHIHMAVDILFLIKWGYRLVVFTGFWAYAFRYIELSLKSKRFLFLVVCEFLGFLSGGIFNYFFFSISYIPVILILFLMSVCVLVALLWKISNFEKVTPELQLKKNGGVSEKIQLKLLYLIYGVAFLFMAVTAFVDYSICLESIKLAQNSINANVHFFAAIWILFSLSALFLLAVLYSLRKAFRITTAMTILTFLPLVCCLGSQANLLWVVLFSKVVLDLISYFCVGYYFRIVPRPLSHGKKGRLKVRRLIVAQPFGFATSALVFYFIPYSESSLWYGCILSIVFLMTFFDCQQEYYKVLLSAFKTFRWRGGRLMIHNTKVLNYVEKKAASSNPQEAVYFLNVLEQARVNNLKNHLRHALSHPDIQVRFFALKCIERNKLHMFKKTLSDVIDKDKNPLVRQAALDVFCALGEKYAVERAVLYLDDPVLRKGAIIGLLKSGGEEILIASEGVNKLAYSEDASCRLEAAEILQETGLKGFFRIVQKLIDDKDIRVKRAALLAAGRLSHTGLLKSIFKSLNKMEVRDEAISALKMFGPSAYPFIEKAFEDKERTELCKKTLISYLWISEDVGAKKLLLSCLKNMDFKLRLYTLHLLKKTHLHVSKKIIKKTFLPLIKMDFKQALATLLLIKDFRFSPNYDAQSAFETLCDSLKRDFENIRQSLLMEVYFCLPSSLMEQAVEILLLKDSSVQQKQVAESTLDDLLPKSYAKLKWILKGLPLEDCLEHIPSRQASVQQSLSAQFELVLKSKSYRSNWTKAAALWCIRKMDYTDLLSDIENLLADSSPIIRENAIWALERLVSSKKELKKIIEPYLKDKQLNIRQMTAEILK